MENTIVKPGGVVIKQLLVVLLLLSAVYLADGLIGFGPFLNLQAILLVSGGTLLLTWTAFPLKELFRPSGPRALRHAAGCAIGMGALSTLLSLMPMLWTGTDTQTLLKQAGAALAGLFYGFLLSKVILAPIAARLE